MMAGECNADVAANEILPSLLAGEVFTLPEVDFTGPGYELPNNDLLYENLTKLTIEDLTSGTVGGEGAFDVIMKSLRAHLREEYDAGRITGDQYSKTYIALTTAALATATQFLLGKDQAFWAAQGAQIAAINANVLLATAKLEYASKLIQANTMKVQFALGKMELATADINYCIAHFNLDMLLPAQKELLSAQVEAAHAQTHDTLTDGVTAVLGSVGKQKELYSQQITSYQRDGEAKFLKILGDTWVTQKTLDEGLVAPNEFTNTVLDEAFQKARENLDLTTP